MSTDYTIKKLKELEEAIENLTPEQINEIVAKVKVPEPLHKAVEHCNCPCRHCPGKRY